MTAGAWAPVRLGTVDLWHIDLEVSGAATARWQGVLSEQEQARASRLARPEVHRRFVAARVALREILSRYVGRPAGALELISGPDGKPELPGGPQFNLSHSGDLAICAVVAGRRVGVDLERTREVPEALDLAHRWLSAAEREVVLSALPEARSLAFLQQWTRREAYLKATGAGLSGKATGEPIDEGRWDVHALRPRAGFVGALVVERDLLAA